MEKYYLTWFSFDLSVAHLAASLVSVRTETTDFTGIYAQPRGGLVLGVALSHRLGLPLYVSEDGIDKSKTLWVDDILDTGKTFHAASEYHTKAVWLVRNHTEGVHYVLNLQGDPKWLVFPWENADRTAVEHDRTTYLSSRA